MTVFTWTLVGKDGTRKGFTEDTTQPAYVSYDIARRLGYGKPFYLPPIELPEEEPIVEKTVIHKHINLDQKALELQGRIVSLETKSHSHTDKKANKYTL